MDQGSFRDRLAFAIGFAISRSRDLLRRIVRQHVPDDARQLLAQRVVRHVKQSGFEICETARRSGGSRRSLHTPRRTRLGLARLNSSSLARINRFATTLIRAEALASLVGELRQRGEAARATSRPSPN